MSVWQRFFRGVLGRGADQSTSAPPAPAPAQKPARGEVDLGFLVFEQTGEVLAAERLLKQKGFAVEVKAPPAALRRGCDMVVVCPLMACLQVQSLLKEQQLEPLDFVPVSDPLLAPVSLFQTTDFGDWFMVRAANMKITVEKATGRIVNVSGGGCPDVPYLAGLLLGRHLDEAGEPVLKGRTLCSYALQKALEEARRQWHG